MNKKYWAIINCWKETNKVYGIFKNEQCVYIGRSDNLLDRFQKHTKYRDLCYSYKIFKLGENKKFDWEKVYIQWYSLKYKLDNKIHNISNRRIYAKDKMRLLTNFYIGPYRKYKKDIILRYHLF